MERADLARSFHLFPALVGAVNQAGPERARLVAHLALALSVRDVQDLAETEVGLAVLPVLRDVLTVQRAEILSRDYLQPRTRAWAEALTLDPMEALLEPA